MGGLLACCACQAVQTLCGCCIKAIPFHQSVSTRVAYVLIFLVTSILSWIAHTWGKQILSWTTYVDLGCDNCAGTIETLSVYRITFGLTIFHLAQAVLLIGVKSTKEVRASLQKGWWFLKIIVWAGLIVIAFTIPAIFFTYYGYLAFAGAIVFISIQLVLLLDFAYNWNESWVRNWEDSDDKKWYYMLLGATFVMYVAPLTGIILMYIYFNPSTAEQGCSQNVSFISVHLVLCVIFSLMSIYPKFQEANQKIGLLQSAVVTSYLTYIVFSALLSNPNIDCNPFTTTSTGSAYYLSLIMGGLITILAVCYSTVRAGSSSPLGGAQPLMPSNDESTKKSEEAPGDGDGDDDDDDDEASGTTYNYSFFHLTFALGAMYVAQLLTNWAVLKQNSSDELIVDSGPAAVWVKIASTWLATLLYIWTLIAPLVLPERDWN